MNTTNELNSTESLEKVLSLIDEFSENSKHSNIRVLELILKLEKKIKSDVETFDQFMERIEELERENLEWMNAFNVISEKLTDVVQSNLTTHSDIFEKADDLIELMDGHSRLEDHMGSDHFSLSHNGSSSESVQNSDDFDDIDNDNLISRN